MSKLILSSALFFASPCFAKVVLDCTLQGADVSRVVIKDEGGRLSMTEVLMEARKTTDGKYIWEVEREVTAQEWASKILTLSVSSPSAKSTLTYDAAANDWFLDHTDRGFNNHGFMRCN